MEMTRPISPSQTASNSSSRVAVLPDLGPAKSSVTLVSASAACLQSNGHRDGRPMRGVLADQRRIRFYALNSKDRRWLRRDSDGVGLGRGVGMPSVA